MEGFERKTLSGEKYIERIRNFIESNKASVVLIFHRHLNHDTVSPEIDELRRITTEDLEYTEDLSSLVLNTDRAVALTVDNLRSYLTSYFILNPNEAIDIATGNQLEMYSQARDSRAIRYLPQLSYKDSTGTEFDKALHEAFKENRPLQFQVEESDRFARQGENVSSYSVIASEIAEVVLKYWRIKDRWERVSQQKFSSKNLFRTLCAREFVYACFRAKLTEKILGMEERDRYVKQFTRNRGAKYVGALGFTQDGKITIEDDYGTLIFDIELVKKIAGENPATTEIGNDTTHDE